MQVAVGLDGGVGVIGGGQRRQPLAANALRLGLRRIGGLPAVETVAGLAAGCRKGGKRRRQPEDQEETKDKPQHRKLLEYILS